MSDILEDLLERAGNIDLNRKPNVETRGSFLPILMEDLYLRIAEFAQSECQKVRDEEKKANFKIFKSLAEALGHDVVLMPDYEIMEIDPYDEIRSEVKDKKYLAQELKEVKEERESLYQSFQKWKKEYFKDLEEERKHSEEYKDERDNLIKQIKNKS